MKKNVLFTMMLFVAMQAFSVNIKFQVSMAGSGVEYDSIFIVGEMTASPETGDWLFVYMAPDPDGEELFSTIIDCNPGDSLIYYFISNNNWDTYLDDRETVPEECANSSLRSDGWDGDRMIVVPEVASLEGWVWSSCDKLGATGINTSIIELDVNVYPNPSKGVLNIDINNENVNSIEILDFAGKLIRTVKNISVNNTIDISDLNKGMYLVKVTDGVSMYTEKIILE